MSESGENRLRSWFKKPGKSRVSWMHSAVSSEYLVAACSDVGRVRQNNEDSVKYNEAGIYLVCDGMGGMAAGEVASGIATDTALGEFLRQSAQKPLPLRMRRAVEAANREVLLAAKTPGCEGMGTTLVAAALDGERLVVANVGDSRAYLVRGGECEQITEDHSYANEMRRTAGIELEDIPQADLQRFGSLITRAVGAGETVSPDFFEVDFHPGDLLVLMTDGLTRYLHSADELLPLVDRADLDGSCKRLIAHANDAGGADNTTVLLLYRSPK